MLSQSKRVCAQRIRLPTWSDLHERLRGRLRRYFLKEAILRRDRPEKAKRFDSETITHILIMTCLVAYGERNLVNNLYQEKKKKQEEKKTKKENNKNVDDVIDL
jgi:hypothetical protein